MAGDARGGGFLRELIRLLHHLWSDRGSDNHRNCNRARSCVIWPLHVLRKLLLQKIDDFLGVPHKLGGFGPGHDSVPNPCLSSVDERVSRFPKVGKTLPQAIIFFEGGTKEYAE